MFSSHPGVRIEGKRQTETETLTMEFSLNRLKLVLNSLSSSQLANMTKSVINQGNLEAAICDLVV